MVKIFLGKVRFPTRDNFAIEQSNSPEATATLRSPYTSIFKPENKFSLKTLTQDAGYTLT